MEETIESRKLIEMYLTEGSSFNSSKRQNVVALSMRFWLQRQEYKKGVMESLPV